MTCMSFSAHICACTHTMFAWCQSTQSCIHVTLHTMITLVPTNQYALGPVTPQTLNPKGPGLRALVDQLWTCIWRY